MSDHRDNHEAYAITPPPAVADLQARIAQRLAEAQSQVLMALEGWRLSQDERGRLRARCDMEVAHIAELKAQVRQLIAERDMLRREVCRHRAAAIQGKKPEDIAAKLRWDCFRELPLDRLAQINKELGL